MNEEQFMALTNEFQGDIIKLVKKFFGKIQQPSHWEFEDLVQESLLFAWKKFGKYDSSKASPRTFLNMCVHNLCYDIMYNSWNSVAPKLFSTFENDEENTFDIEELSGVEDVPFRIQESVFSEKEQEYINLYWDPPILFAQKVARSPRRVRVYIREAMSISLEEEGGIRKSIKSKLEATV